MTMIQYPYTVNAAKRPRKPAKVTEAQSGASQQNNDSECFSNIFGPGVNFEVPKIIARPTSRGKYYDLLDERMLALGIFIDTLKQERLKNDPHFAFTMEFYRDAMHDFNSLNDERKAMYIAEAQKRNTVEDDAVAAKWVAKKQSDIKFYDDDKLEAKAIRLYNHASEAQRQKDKGKSTVCRQTYFVALKTAEERCPYLAEATVRQLEERVEVVKKLELF